MDLLMPNRISKWGCVKPLWSALVRKWVSCPTRACIKGILPSPLLYFQSPIVANMIRRTQHSAEHTQTGAWRQPICLACCHFPL